jgi:hypothetical protein
MKEYKSIEVIRNAEMHGRQDSKSWNRLAMSKSKVPQVWEIDAAIHTD